MKRCLLLLIGLLSLLPASAQEQDFSRLFQLFKNASRFDYDYPREKVFLHLDNDAYFENETIWFKAYVVRASSLKPQPLSRVLYVELLNADGALVERKLLRVDADGQANGEFDLKLPVREGFYEVRAYTREMTNWGTEACFSRVVPVFKAPQTAGDFSQLDIRRPAGEWDMAPGHERQVDFGKKSDVRLTFYPEGGHRIEGLTQRIAFQITDGRGTPLDTPLQIVSDGKAIVESAPTIDGMGIFTLPANAANAYAQVGGKRFNLPAATAAEDYALTVSKGQEETSVIVQKRQGAAPRLLGLAVTCREEVCYFDTLTVGDEAIELILYAKAFHGGVNRVELFDASGASLCRRLVWHEPEARNLTLNVRQNKAEYEPFEPIALEMNLRDSDGRPVETCFSLAVRDSEGDLIAASPQDIGIDLLLSSELKGYVRQPRRYFDSAFPQRDRALDLLLLVQGWSANSFAVMNGTEPFQLREPIEESLVLKGTVYKDNDKRIPQADMNLSLKMFTREGGALEGEARTDSLGRFAFQSNVDFLGDWIAQFTTVNDKGKRRWSRIALDRWFSVAPQPFRLSDWDIEEAAAGAGSENATAGAAPTDVETFVWTDTIPQTLSTTLSEAVVIKHTAYKGLTGNRYSYNGGEKAGMAKADIYYNIEQRIEQLKDHGEAVGTIWDVLAGMDKLFWYDKSLEAFDPIESNHAFAANQTAGSALSGEEYAGNAETSGEVEFSRDKLEYGSMKLGDVFLNNYDQDVMLNEVIWAEEIKSAIIMRGRNKWINFASDITAHDGTAEDALFLYSRPDYKYFQTKKGVDKRMVQGYAQPREFYCPNYRQTDMPNADDVRRTLYWNPSVKTDKNGNASAVFFSNARERQTLRISASGISSDGQFVDYQK